MRRQWFVGRHRFGPRFAQLTLLLVVTLGTVAGCSKSPIEPTPPPTPRPTPTPDVTLGVTVVSGWDRMPVPGAVVKVGDALTTADEVGRVTVKIAGGNLRTEIDIDATGYLARRTRASSITAANELTLWPVAGEAEASAIRTMVFYNGKVLGRLYSQYFLTLLPDQSGSSPASAPWLAEFDQIRALTGLEISLSTSPRGEDDELVVNADATAASCTSSWGFCSYHEASCYFCRPIHLVRDLSVRHDVILRALTHVILKPNPLPGLMNADAPASDLSLLEKQTLKMVFQRQSGTVWPDSDPDR